MSATDCGEAATPLGPAFSAAALALAALFWPPLPLAPGLDFCLRLTTTLGASVPALCFGAGVLWGVVVVCGVVVVGEGVVLVVGEGVVPVVVGVVLVSGALVVLVPVPSEPVAWMLPPLGRPSAEARGPAPSAVWAAAPPSPAAVSPPPASADSSARVSRRRCQAVVAAATRPALLEACSLSGLPMSSIRTWLTQASGGGPPEVISADALEYVKHSLPAPAESPRCLQRQGVAVHRSDRQSGMSHRVLFASVRRNSLHSSLVTPAGACSSHIARRDR